MDTELKDLPINADSLSIGYRDRKKGETLIASNLNIALKPGELVCLLGPNGTGKSTLIRTLAGMQPALAGNIHFSGTALSELSPKKRAQRISVVLTDTTGSGLMTVYSLVALGRHPRTNWAGTLGSEDRKRIQWALESVGADNLAHRYLGELSDGERQKVMIARALAQDAPVMLLDEPTAYIDLTRRVELMRILRDLTHREKLSILVSTHDLDLALRSADRLWLMTKENGIQQGIPEVLALERKIASAFSSDKLDWDDEQGTFRVHRNACITVHLKGSGPEAMWTRRLLARFGYGIDNLTAESKYVISLERINDRISWIVEFKGASKRFNTFEVFAEWLRSESE